MPDIVRQAAERKAQGSPIVMLTAYDATMAAILAVGGVDWLLVGDSLGNVVQGADTTRVVTLSDMAYHVRCVVAGAEGLPVIADLPWNSDNSPREAVESARALCKAGACAVKLEGAKFDAVRAIVADGIPVMGHLGVLPQTATSFKAVGREEAQAQNLLSDARELERAGAFSLVLECVTDATAQAITRSLAVPTIGIGAGRGCDGQVLVFHDLFGLVKGRSARFVKKYLDLYPAMTRAVAEFCKDVASRRYPDDEHSYH